MKPLPVGSTIGILGDGQLGRMLAGAAAKLGFDVVVFGPNLDSPASRVASQSIFAEYADKDALAEFSVRCDAITLEFENVPVEAVQTLLDMEATVRPGPRSLEICQDRLFEKQFAQDLGIETTHYWDIQSASDLQAALEDLSGKGILKTRRDGYDGHGQVRLETGDHPATAIARIDSQPAILEAMVPFIGEISCVLARSADGSMVGYEPARNVHKHGILDTSTVPSGYSDDILSAALENTQKIAEALGHIGVLAVEYFVLEDGRIVFNEIAPRVHNSGHWTPQACHTGQFEQHIRAVAGWSLGPATRYFDVEMTNLLGDDIYKEFAPDDMVTLYGKREARAGRKMGHVVRKI